MSIDNVKILICDDSILARKQLKDLLTALGCTQIKEVSDGLSAVDTYKTYMPDLVFLDIVMPVKDGITAVTEILTYDSHAKVVMASSVGTQNHLKEALKAGAFDFVQKPLNEEQIKRIVMTTFRGGK